MKHLFFLLTLLLYLLKTPKYCILKVNLTIRQTNRWSGSIEKSAQK